MTTVAGQAPVDSECTSLSGKVHVYSENKDIFDCMLNQVRNFSKNLIGILTIFFYLDKCRK